MAEKNLIGELDMYREAGIKPNFSDIAKRYGKDRHTVASYWRAEGGRPHDGRGDRAGSFDAHVDEVAAKAQLPGVTKRGIYEWLLRRYPDEDLAGYNAFTQFTRKNGIVIGPPGGPEPHPRFETPPGLQLQFDWKESVKMANRDGELLSSTCSLRRWATPAGTYSSGRRPGRPTTWSGACTPRSRGSAARRASGSRTTCPPW